MQNDKIIRVYADGVFDSFHIGHANMFRQCRKSFPDQKILLIGGVCAQTDVEQHKGPTISTEKQRIEMVRQCKWVDEVFEQAPWVITEDFINQQNIDYVCHDDAPYNTNGIEDAYSVCKKLGKFKPTQRTEGISTTDVVAKILRNKEIGVSRSKLGLSYFKYIRLKIEMMLCPHRHEKLKDI